MREDQGKNRPLQILLLTNCNSDNLGDWMIEACDIALISLVMENLGFSGEEYGISSYAIGDIVYDDEAGHVTPERVSGIIRPMDLIIFGGAPVFNHKYQSFYEETLLVLKLAQETGTPVLFSAIGLEKYQKTDPKCRRITDALQQSCVKQITTRDDLDSLRQYTGSRKIPLQKTADPAVYTAEVFRKFVPQREPARVQKKIGLFVLRAGGFQENGINLSRQEMLIFWKRLTQQLEAQGNDYTLLGSGNYGDEAFIEDLIMRGGISSDRCLFNLTSPEDLVRTIASFDAVVSCRLHPSVLAYSLGIPSLGIVWNEKVSGFYEAIGCPDRIFTADDLDPVKITARIGEILDAPAQRVETYRYSVYRTLFDGIRKRAAVRKAMGKAKSEPAAYTPEQVAAKLPAFEGTAAARKLWYAKRKSTRAYDELNRLKLKKDSYILICNSGRKDWDLSACTYDSACGSYKVLPSGKLEYRLQERWLNTGREPLQKVGFVCSDGGAFLGWHIRIKNKGIWHWYLEGGIMCPINVWKKEKDRPKVLLEDGAPLPVFALESQDAVVLEAVWQPAALHAGPADSIDKAPAALDGAG